MKIMPFGKHICTSRYPIVQTAGFGLLQTSWSNTASVIILNSFMDLTDFLYF